MQCRVTVRGTADGGSVGFGPDLSCTDVVLYTFMLSCFQNRVVARVTPESCLTEIRFSWAAPNSLQVPSSGVWYAAKGRFTSQMETAVSTGLLRPRTSWRTWSGEASGAFTCTVSTTSWSEWQTPGSSDSAFTREQTVGRR